VSDDIAEAPATVLGADVQRLLEQCPPVVVAHSERSYQFAAAFAAADGVALDAEVLYLGTVLHDVGLSPAASGSDRFEVRGADRVRALLRERGMERDRADNVWDCIAMHASSALARNKSSETRYSNRGIALDVAGRGAEALTPSFVRAVLDRWPRHEFPAGFERVLADEVRTNPDSVRMSWLESVASAHVPGFVPTDFLAGLRATRDFV
jgi:hypothetical protein